MKHITITLLLLATALCATAQTARLDRYPDIPTAYEKVFVDAVSGHIANQVKSAYGQYFGQLDTKSNIYGFGAFFMDDGSQVTGQWLNGELIVGIKMASDIVKVGTENHYTVYDLTTGNALCVMKDGQKYDIDAEHQQAWKFLKMTYANGAAYVGEVVNGQRDGYGIYYYSDGNFYFGRYASNKPVGYGALFRTDNRLVIEDWNETPAE